MNKKTVTLTQDQYREIIQTMREGFTGAKPNPRIAAALMLEANLGLRISDILRLRLSDIVRDGSRYRLAITEQKTGKQRDFTVPLALYQWIRIYSEDNGIRKDEPLFPLTERQIQKAIAGIAGSRTIIAIAHRLSTIRGADQILVIENGSITESGTHEELLALGGSYARMYRIQTTSIGGIA